MAQVKGGFVGLGGGGTDLLVIRMKLFVRFVSTFESLESLLIKERVCIPSQGPRTGPRGEEERRGRKTEDWTTAGDE